MRWNCPRGTALQVTWPPRLLAFRRGGPTSVCYWRFVSKEILDPRERKNCNCRKLFCPTCRFPLAGAWLRCARYGTPAVRDRYGDREAIWILSLLGKIRKHLHRP